MFKPRTRYHYHTFKQIPQSYTQDMHNYVVTLLLILEGIEHRSFKINITQLS